MALQYIPRQLVHSICVQFSTWFSSGAWVRLLLTLQLSSHGSYRYPRSPCFADPSFKICILQIGLLQTHFLLIQSSRDFNSLQEIRLRLQATQQPRPQGNKSPGPDKISARVIKDCLPVILGPLTDIINCSILTSTFPDNWKDAEVIPILKDGDHEKAANNRPLSLLAVVSKVLERIVLNQFSAYLTKNNRLTSHQSGNKKAHSTETLNILLTDKILEAMDKKQITAVVLY